MHFEKLLNERWSCRAYRPEQVSEETMTQLFAIAQRTASWCNTQPWKVIVTRGTATKRFADALVRHATAGTEVADLDMPAGYHGVYKERRQAAGWALYDSLGITRENWDARVAQRLRNFEFFGAPHTAIITTDREHGTYGAIDCGGYVANLVNAATSLGLASIPQAAIAMHSGFVRNWFEIGEDRLVVCAVSFGYADDTHPVNTFRTSRATVSDAVRIVSD